MHPPPTPIALLQGLKPFLRASLFGFCAMITSNPSHAQNWTKPVVVSKPGVTGTNFGQHTSIKVVKGTAAIAYYDVSMSGIAYVRATNVLGSKSVTGFNWQFPVSIDTAGNTGFYISLCLVNGYPAVAYYDSTNGDLKYARANDSFGLRWGPPRTIASTGNVGLYTSLCVVNGNPAISYFDATNGDLKYVRAADNVGSSWNSPITLQAAGIIGKYNSMCIVHGNPAISYYDQSGKRLRYVRALNANGSTWAAPTIPDGTGDAGQYCTLVVIEGNPAIAYRQAVGKDLKYVRATDTNGNTWGTPVTVDTAGDVGEYANLIGIGQFFKPLIAYYDRTNGLLKWCFAADSIGATWYTPRYPYTGIPNAGEFISATSQNYNNGGVYVVHISYYDRANGALRCLYDYPGIGSSIKVPVSPTGEYSSMGLANGNPAVAYFDGSTGVLKYVRAKDAGGSAWGNPVTVDSAGVAGLFISYCQVNGKPAMAYYDYLKFSLKYVQALDSNGNSWGIPTTIDNTAYSGYYNSLCVVNGKPAISYHQLNINKKNLMYVRALDADGNKWGNPKTVRSSAYDGLYTSLAVVGGYPAISYQNEIGDDCQYIRAKDSAGDTWGSPVKAAKETTTTGLYNSLSIANGRPAVAFYNSINSNLRYSRANDSLGSSWGNSIVLDYGFKVGTFASLIMMNGIPAVAYYDEYNANLKFVMAKDSSGNSWNNPMKLDSSESVGKYASMKVLGNNRLGITYYDKEGKVKFISACFDNTASLASSTPSLCVNTPMTAITHKTTGATGFGSISNLPPGIATTLSNNTITLSGTPTKSGTYNYSIPLTGGCGSSSVSATGTITVKNTNVDSVTTKSCDSFTWTTSGNTYHSSGSYKATLTNSQGCDSVITLNLTISNSSHNTVNATSCDSFSWLSSGLTYRNSGLYKISLSGYQGCDSAITLNLTINTSPALTTSLSGATITASQAGANYQWINCSDKSEISGATSQSYTPTKNGDYAVVVTLNNCGDTSTCVTVSNLGLNRPNAQNTQVQIVPNPNGGQFILRSNNSPLGMVTIHNSIGEIVYSGRFNQQEIVIDISELSNGIYVVQTSSEAGVNRLKLVVSK